MLRLPTGSDWYAEMHIRDESNAAHLAALLYRAGAEVTAQFQISMGRSCTG